MSRRDKTVIGIAKETADLSQWELTNSRMAAEKPAQDPTRPADVGDRCVTGTTGNVTRYTPSVCPCHTSSLQQRCMLNKEIS